MKIEPKKDKKCGLIYKGDNGQTGATCANLKPCFMTHIIKENDKQVCLHDFRYSHTEYPPMGTCTAIPPNKEVVICPKCGKLRKTLLL